MALGRVPGELIPSGHKSRHEASLNLAGDASFIETLANAPWVLDWYFDSFYGQLFYGGRVPVRLKELARLRMAHANGCEF